MESNFYQETDACWDLYDDCELCEINEEIEGIKRSIEIANQDTIIDDLPF